MAALAISLPALAQCASVSTEAAHRNLALPQRSAVQLWGPRLRNIFLGSGSESRRQRRRGWRSMKVAAVQSTEMRPEVGKDFGSQFEGVELISTSGERKSVADLWRDRKVVIAWSRHFGCLLCKKRAAKMQELKGTFDAAGAALVVIGPGNKDQANSFKDQTQFSGEVYADPTSASFKKLGFVFGPGSIFTPKALKNLVGASLEGFKQDWGLSFQMDTVMRGGWQQGGVMVAGPGVHNILFLHKDKEAGDEPEWSEVVAAAREK